MKQQIIRGLIGVTIAGASVLATLPAQAILYKGFTNFDGVTNPPDGSPTGSGAVAGMGIFSTSGN